MKKFGQKGIMAAGKRYPKKKKEALLQNVTSAV